jgi:hypothetical protein
LKKEIHSGRKLNLVFDTATSSDNRRWINIVLYGTIRKIWDLGLYPISGSMTAENQARTIEKILQDFKLSFEDILTISCDGCQTNIKMFRDLNKIFQLCLVHGLNLGVVKALYKK